MSIDLTLFNQCQLTLVIAIDQYPDQAVGHTTTNLYTVRVLEARTKSGYWNCSTVEHHLVAENMKNICRKKCSC